MPAVADIQNSIVKEFENEPRVVTPIMNQGEPPDELSRFWRNIYLRGQMVLDPDQSVADGLYEQPRTWLPFSCAWVIGPDQTVVAPIFGHQPQRVIDTTRLPNGRAVPHDAICIVDPTREKPGVAPMTASPQPPCNLRCESLTNPLGIDTPRPRLSWRLDDARRGATQSAYQILVAGDPSRLAKPAPDVWDSGVVRAARSIHVPYGGPPLESARRYWWTVRCWDQDGQPSRYAAPAWWEMGLLKPADWVARWIAVPDAAAAAPTGPCRSHYMRRAFTLKRALRDARVHVTGLGIYELHLNGHRIGEDVFTPGWTAYDKRIQYQTYDITPLLRPGPNAIGALLGNGWWGGGQGIGRNHRTRMTAGNLRLLLQLRVTGADGAVETIRSDAYWKTAPSPIVQDTFYDGEVYDARLEQPGWDTPDFDDRTWQPVVELDAPACRLTAQSTPAIRVTEELPPRSITQPQPGAHVFDFGQNHAGRCRLRLRGAAGTRVQLRFAEILFPDGTLDRRNLRGATCTDVYILRGGAEEVWEPRFTYRGYRYAELTGFPGQPSSDTLVSRVLHDALEPAGQFTCSHELLNRVHHITRWALRSNLHSVPTDCPQRDERLGWLGDAHLFAPAGCYLLDMATFFAKWLWDIRDTQEADGHVTDVAPAVAVAGPAAPGWGDAITGIPLTHHAFYGDPRVLEQNYEAARAWTEYMRGHAPEHLYDCQHGHQKYGYGDWVAPEESPREPIATAFYYYSVRNVATMARRLGRKADADQYAALAEQIRAAFNSAYFDPRTDNYVGRTQTANLLPVALGLAPDNRVPAIVANIARNIADHDDHLTTGFIGTAFLLDVLSDHGYHELAYRVATQRTYPSWGHMIAAGATTMCERWNPDTGDLGMNSWNHFALGAVCAWFYGRLGGVRPNLADAAQPFVIHPQPAGDLTWARADYRSVYGPVSCAWRRTPARLAIEVTIPANAGALLRIPTLGCPTPTITEGTTTLVRNGQALEDVDGLRRIGPHPAANAVQFQAAAGRYQFTVTV